MEFLLREGLRLVRLRLRILLVSVVGSAMCFGLFGM